MTPMTAAPRPITAYLPQGGFGKAVVARLAQPQDVVLPVDKGLVSAAVPYADRLVLVSDPDRTGLREDLDALSFTRGLPSLGLELLPTELRCGPLVIPGRTACYGCYERRRRQHGHRPLPEGLGPLPQGYAHHHVVLGAGLVSMALDLLDRQTRPAATTPGAAPGTSAADAAPAQSADDPDQGLGGQVWGLDLVSGSTSCSSTVAVDRCPTCSTRYAHRRDGLPALAGLLPRRQPRQAVV